MTYVIIALDHESQENDYSVGLGEGRILQEKLDGDVSRSFSLSIALTLKVWFPAPRLV